MIEKGFINIDKPKGVTSAYVIARLKKHYNIKKIGHMGTLDPLATGVLPVAIGRATRMFDYFLQKEKSYIATFRFGFETDTLDIEGSIIKSGGSIPNEDEVKTVINAYVKEYDQAPPQFSAKKVNGKKAYEYARDNVKVELKPKRVSITEFKLLSTHNNDYTFKISCTSGTYIRSIARDIGHSLNTYCTMIDLKRVKSGVFNIDNAYKLDDILSCDKPISNYIVDIVDIFKHYKTIQVDDEQYFKLKNGRQVPTHMPKGIYFVKHNDTLLGVSKITNNILKINTFLL